mgnify:CR=1 FL=1
MNFNKARQKSFWPLQESNKKYFPKLWQKISAGILFLIALFFILNIFESQIKNYFYSNSSPFSRFLWQASSGSSKFASSFFNAFAISQENHNLKQENEKLLLQLHLLKGKLTENDALGEFSSNKSESDNFDAALAHVIYIDIFEDFILIDKGKEDGILQDMPVISGQKAVFGKVVESYKNFSKVMLISNKNSALDVKIESADSENSTENTIYGAVKGSGNLSVYLDLVPLEAEIKEGDLLVTSALEKTFPKGLLSGKIISVNKDDLKPFQTAQVRPFFDIKNTENLFVIINYKSEQ